MDEHTRPQLIAPRDCGRVYSSNTVVCILLLLIRFSLVWFALSTHPFPLMTEHFRHVLWWTLCFCVRDRAFFAMASARPRWYTTEQAMEFIMNYNSDEKDHDVASFLLCSMFYCHCVVHCLCCVLSHFMSITSLHVLNIFLTQLHNYTCSVLQTKRKQTLQLCKTNISTLLSESFKPFYSIERDIRDISCCGCPFATHCSAQLVWQGRAVMNSWGKMC